MHQSSCAGLFNAFEQADSSTTRKCGRTGLGLAINQRPVTLMGGDVGVRSTVGSGSTFSLAARLGKVAKGETVAPADSMQAERGRGQEQQPDAGRFRGCRVLLVEDNPVNQDVAVELLRVNGLSVDVASDGLEALDMVAKQSYDLILMDVQMPRMDGLAATRAIRGGGAAQRTPIVAMTANAFEEDRRQCLAAGMNDHIAKPVEMRVLIAALARWLPLRPAATAEVATEAPSRRSLFEAIPGLHIKTGLAYVQGRFDRYEVLLRKYMVSATSDLAKLAAAAAADDRSAIAAAAHSLRGAAAVVGATTVERSAHAIEAVVRGSGSAESLSLAIAELRAAQEHLAAALNAVATPPA